MKYSYKRFTLIELMITMSLTSMFAVFGFQFFANISKMNESTVIRMRFINNAREIRQKLLYGKDRRSGLLSIAWYQIPTTLDGSDNVSYDYVDVKDNFAKKNQIRFRNEAVEIKVDGSNSWEAVGDLELEIVEFDYKRTFDIHQVPLLAINILYKMDLNNGANVYYYEQAIREPLPRD